MKKTYTACFILALSSLFYYSDLTGKGSTQCTRNKGGGYAALANSAPNCAAGCHGLSGLSTDSAVWTSTGIYNLSFTEGIAVYPTLASDRVNIETNAPIAGGHYDVYGIDGRNMMTGTLPSSPALTAINIDGLSPAHYVIRVTDASHSASFRFVKK